MPLEMLGMVGTKEVSESLGSLDGPVIDTDYLTRFAQAHEAAGFDRVLIGYGATGPDGFAIAAHVGTPRQVADALAEYRKAGIDTILIRGFDPLGDVEHWGRELLPLLRAQAEAGVS